MPLNVNQCSTCSNFDPIVARGKPTTMGRCAAKSVYPAQEMKGQTFPPDVKRAMPGELAQIKVVRGRQIEGHCGEWKSKPVAPATPAKAVR